jgi:uncharacterized membrane protein
MHQKKIDITKPHISFILLATILSIAYCIITPPFQASDEANHFYRTYQISNGHFLPIKTNNRLGGKIPKSITDFKRPYELLSTNLGARLTKQNRKGSNTVVFSEHESEFLDFPNTAYYSPISYVPQATAVFISKHIFTNVSTAYYLGRIAASLTWILLIAWAIKLIPFHKWTLVCLALLPMNLYITNSFSADTVSNGLCFVFIALILKYCAQESKPITKKQIALMLILGVLIALAKIVYVGLVVLIVAIPTYQFKNVKQRWFIVTSVCSTCFIAALAWSSVVNYFYIPFINYNEAYRNILGFSECANYDLQKEYILNHSSYFFKVIFHSIFDHPHTYLKSFVGQLGQFDIIFSDWICVAAYFVIFSVIGLDRSEFKLNSKQRIIGLLAAFISFVLLLLSQHLTWDCVGEGVVDLVQGRYLIPILPLIFIMLFNYCIPFKLKPIWVVVPFIIGINAYGLTKVYERFHKQTEAKKIAFYANMETEKNGAFLTTDKYCTINPSSQQTNKYSFSGKHSIMLCPSGKGNEFGCNFEFTNTQNTCYYYIEAMIKGSGVKLIFSGESSDGQKMYSASTYVANQNKNGWYKINMGASLFNPSKTKKFIIYAWNTSTDTVYIDDLRFEYRGYKNTDF